MQSLSSCYQKNGKKKQHKFVILNMESFVIPLVFSAAGGMGPIFIDIIYVCVCACACVRVCVCRGVGRGGSGTPPVKFRLLQAGS